jgi:hypothetical protein
VIGPKIAHQAVLEIRSRSAVPPASAQPATTYPSPLATKHAPRMGDKLAGAILAALDEQTVVSPRHHRRRHCAASLD